MHTLEQVRWKEKIREWGTDIGFVALGFSAATPSEGLAEQLQTRLEQGLGTPWESGRIELRTNPRAGWPACRTVVALAYPLLYSSPPREGVGVLAHSAVGEDYHRLVLRKIGHLIEMMKAHGWPGTVRWQVDTGPLNERAFARRAGIGWIGRNQQLIVPDGGYFVALGLLLLDQELEPDQSLQPGQCGACQKCIAACPAQILGPEPFTAKNCVSYLTQSKNILSQEESERLGLSIFGCDICQMVCPHNRRRVEMEQTGSYPLEQGIDPLDVLNLSKTAFQKQFGQTAAGWRGKSILQRNAFLAAVNSRDERVKIWLAERQSKNSLPPSILPYLTRS